MRFFKPIHFVFFFAFTYCSHSQEDPAFSDYDLSIVPYQLNEPNNIVSLHYDLEEISGLSFFNDSTLLAVQDEKGKLYFINNENGKIRNEIKFAKSGDYEGVEFIDGLVYVVASNGKLVSFRVDGAEAKQVNVVETELSSKNDVEGLGIVESRIVLVCKASGELGNNSVKGKAGYFFDTSSRRLKTDPAFSFRLKELQDFIKDRSHFNKIIDFDPSGMAQHPMSKDIYIITADRALLVLSNRFKIKELVKLPRKYYKQPEGICFSADGTLYISNEGDGARAKLISLDYLK